jgi:RNA polymerase sigma factor (sigma-70 family)
LAGNALSHSVKELTTLIARGDREAFADFYRAWFDPMYAEAKWITARDEAFCLDVVQDAMLRVIRSLRPVETERELAAWIKTVVRTSAYDRLRSECRRSRHERSASEQNHQLGTEPPTVRMPT